MTLYTIDAGLFKLDGGAMFGVVPKSLWSRSHPPDENNLCTWAMRCLLIEEGDRLILIDNGIGNKQDEKFMGHYHLHGNTDLQASLRAKGFDASDVTDVFLTHLHFDHCGGSVVKQGDQLITAFPNATYWSNERHWQWAIKPNAREKASFLSDNILPIERSGQLKFLKEGERLSEGFDVQWFHGHTDAMMIPMIRYKGQTIVFMADLLPSVHHLPLAWVMAYDMFPMTTLTEKERFLNEAATNGYILYFEHDRDNECCTVMHTEKGVRLKEKTLLTEVS
jgi:glyoxylase-like metal-dependent hydrolase (beta-lactamase superfamily II)